MRIAVCLLLCGLSLASCAAPVVVGGASLELPSGWNVVRESPNSVSASPNRDMTPPVLSVQICQRSQPDCATPCEAEKIRQNFFFFSAGPGRFSMKEPLEVGGVTEFIASGIAESEAGPIEIAAHVLCSRRGIAFLGLINKPFDTTIDQLLEKTAKSVLWE